MGRGVPSPQEEGLGRGSVPPQNFLHFHVEMARFFWGGGILAVNFKFYSINKTLKIRQNPMDKSKHDAIKMQTIR